MLETFVDFLHLPSNGVIAKIALRDFDLLFEGQIFKTLISLERSELAQRFTERRLKISICANE